MKVLSKGDSINYSILFDEIANIQKNYNKDGYVFICSSKILELLSYLGVSNSELDFLQTVSNNLLPDPTLKFRQSRNGRFFHDNSHNLIYRT